MVKRQAAGSPIIAGAHGINQGRMPVAGETPAGNLYILRAKSPSEDGGLHAQRRWSKARCGSGLRCSLHSTPCRWASRR